MSTPRRLVGCVDQVGSDMVGGWLLDRENPEPPFVVLEIGGRVIARQRCDLERPDVQAAGFGAAGHGFEFDLPWPVPPGTSMEVRSVPGGVPLEWKVTRPIALPAEPTVLRQPTSRPAQAPELREAMLTVALHGPEMAAAVVDWAVAAPSDSSSDALLYALLLQLARCDAPGAGEPE